MVSSFVGGRWQQRQRDSTSAGNDRSCRNSRGSEHNACSPQCRHAVAAKRAVARTCRGHSAAAANLQLPVEFPVARRAFRAGGGALRLGRKVGKLRLAMADRRLRHASTEFREPPNRSCAIPARAHLALQHRRRRTALLLPMSQGAAPQIVSIDHDCSISCLAASAMHPDPLTQHAIGSGRKCSSPMIPIAAPHRGTSRLGIETRKSGAGFSVLSQRHACKLETSAPLLHFQIAEGHDAVANDRG